MNPQRTNPKALIKPKALNPKAPVSVHWEAGPAAENCARTLPLVGLRSDGRKGGSEFGVLVFRA